MAWAQAGMAFGPPVLSAIGEIFGGGAARKRKKQSYAEFERLGRKIEGGIDPSAITSQMPMMMRAMMPFINQAFGKGAAKFGSRSGAAMGAGMSGVHKAVSVPMAQQMSRLPFANFQALQNLARMRSSLAG